MAKRKKRKLWSLSRLQHPKYEGFTVRITELRPAGTLYVVRMVNGKQKMTSLGLTRTDLGRTAPAPRSWFY